MVTAEVDSPAALVKGPSWGGRDSRVAGRYPLAVENHVMNQVDELLPGVTAVTRHARYYTLHAVIADEAQRRGLDEKATQDLVRRCEVVIAGIALVHTCPFDLGRPHGGDLIHAEIQGTELDVDDLSRPGRYAKGPWGFRNTYGAPEQLLGLVVRHGDSLAPGPTAQADLPGLRAALGRVVELAHKDSIDPATLAAAGDCCLCRGSQAADGHLLRRLLVPTGTATSSKGGHRRDTIRLLLRGFQTQQVSRITDDLGAWIAYDETLRDDPVAGRLDIADAWAGVVLRNWSVSAWRDLWAGLVNDIDGFSTVDGLADVLCDGLPAVTVAQYVAGLPDVGDERRTLAAEVDESVRNRDGFDRDLARIAIGSQRLCQLPPRQLHYFEDQSREARAQLTPSWVAHSLEDWQGRPLHDYARWLTGILVARSQRVALKKAAFHQTSGTYQVPTRVVVRDGLIFRANHETNSPIGYRWESLASIMAGVGLCHPVDKDGGRVWRPTELGEEVIA